MDIFAVINKLFIDYVIDMRQLLRNITKGNQKTFANLWRFFAYDQRINIKKINQVGGYNKIKTFNVNGTELSVNVQIVNMDGDDNKNYELNILSLDDKKNHCATLLIYKEENIGILQDLFNYKTCITSKNKYYGKKIGTNLIKIIIGFAKKYKLKKIQLTDNSTFMCNNKLKISLIRARTITGQVPWYMKFGFKPMNEDTKYVIKKNYKNMENILTKDVKLINEIKLIIKNKEFIKNIKKLKKIIKYISNHKTDKLTKTMKYILYNDCYLFFYLLRNIYGKIGLISYDNSKSFSLKL